MTQKSAVVTGVSSGIGRAIAGALVRGGFRVFGSVRRADDAARLAHELGDAYVPLLFDVTDEAAVRAAAVSVRDQLGGHKLAALVNNAGVAVAGPIEFLSTEEFRRELDVNLVSVLTVTREFLPLLGADRSLSGLPGRVVNISSVSGVNALPFMGPYAASKHGLEGFSESLRRELMVYGIDVIVISPGSIATPIWTKAEQADLSVYDGTAYEAALRRTKEAMLGITRAGLPAERVGDVVLEALTSARPRVRYAVVSKGRQSLLQSILPKRVVDRAIARRLGLTPRR
jgi:NAD(P)-dependent dehydrogenase (short-subunit alcohol dehydrogenase family)